MHPRNIYCEERPDFKKLALKYPEFRKNCRTDQSGKIFLDFKNADAVRALTIVLLKEDFQIELSLPPDSLVPRIPQRLNYILWVEDLLNQLDNSISSGDVWGCDIGTGASCIYPLMGSKLLSWNFIATEKNTDAISSARRNVVLNNLEDKIEVYGVDEQTALCPVVDSCQHDIHFCMCNPPFYDMTEIEDGCTSRDTRPQPHSSTTAKTDEVAAVGGEVAFVSRIIVDSAKLRKKIKVYTSMVGKKSSLGPLKNKLKDIKVEDWTATTFRQGKTLRWALAWTFLPNVKLKISYNNPTKDKAPLVLELKEPTLPAAELTGKICSVLSDLKIDYEDAISDEPGIVAYNCTAAEDTWSHSRRKRRCASRCNDNDSFKRFCNQTTQADTHDANSHVCKNRPSPTFEDRPQSISTDNQQDLPLSFTITIAQADPMKLTFNLKAGTKHKLHQVLQYFRNCLKSKMQ